MSLSVHPHSYVPYGASLTGSSIDDLIRPGLKLAYPLPSEEASEDEEFQRLLELLAERQAGQSKVSSAAG
jgi:hypothetical protein